jgi:hypothetical protein
MSRRDHPAPKDLLPLSPTVFHMLLVLGEGERPRAEARDRSTNLGKAWQILF